MEQKRRKEERDEEGRKEKRVEAKPTTKPCRGSDVKDNQVLAYQDQDNITIVTNIYIRS